MPVSTEAVAPKGWENTVLRLKRSGRVDNPWALAWYMKNHGMHPHAEGVDDDPAFNAALDEALAALANSALSGAVDASLPVAMPSWQRPSGVYVLPETLGASVRATAAALAAQEIRVSKSALLYAEKPGAFQCGTCRYVTPANRTHGRCDLLTGTVNLEEGCCAAWDANPNKLHSYRTPEAAGSALHDAY